MKKFFIISAFVMLSVNIIAQTLIATTFNQDATANHNQRKIVRDSNGNIYIVFVDLINQVSIIKGVMYDNPSGQWKTPFLIANGKNPTLAISADNQIHLIFESNDAMTQIIHTSTSDFTIWTPSTVISDPVLKNKLPVADIDSMGRLNIFWILKNENLTDSLVYGCVSGDTLVERKCILGKDIISDIAIANHLQYGDNNLFFAIQYHQDSVQIFSSVDGMESQHALFAAKGTQPCISYNSLWDYEGFGLARLLFIDTDLHLTEVEVDAENGFWDSNQLPCWFFVEYVCIDDIAPPIGYSYLYMDAGVLTHGFSYGPNWDWNTILETIYNSDISNPSIAYKHFNFEYVDFVWMEYVQYGYGYNIYYQRDAKHIWLNIKEDEESGKGFSVTGYPNPFSGQLALTISVENENVVPSIQIYNSNSELIKTLDIERTELTEYSSHWTGTNETGEKVKAGMYVIICSVGDKRTARKVILQPE